MKTLQSTPDDFCHRCGKRMSFTAGPDATSGVLDVIWVCESCGYVAEQRRWTHAEIRRRIAAVNARYGSDGVGVPMVFTSEPFPVGEFDD